MNIDFIKQRITVYAGMEIDPTIDSQVAELMKRKFNVSLPQRASFDDALSATICDHEIVSLIIKYRSMANK